MRTRDIDEILAQQSSQLLEDMRSGDTTAPARLAKFLAESKRHVEHYLLMVALDHELPHLDQEGLWTVGPTSPEKVVSLTQRDAQPEHRTPKSRLLFSLAAALVASVLVLAGVYMFGGHTRTYVTALGEQRALELEDGSVVHLNTSTRLEVEFREHERVVRLLSGEALFKVHH
ncbi:MAG: FecR domain-containing protein, partial [Gammaproteobacteria bacterium]